MVREADRPDFISDMQPSAAQLFQSAIQHHQAGRLAQAEPLYRHVLSLEPRHADALHMLGILAHQCGKNSIAMDLVRRAIAINAAVPIYHCNLGLILNAQSAFKEAADALELALRIDPTLAAAHNNLGIALWKTGHRDRALQAWKEAIRLNPSLADASNNLASAYADLGRMLMDEGIVRDAVDAYRQAVQLKPSDPAVHSSLIYLLHFLPENDEVNIHREVLNWNARHAAPVAQPRREHANDRDPDRRLRIGYVSPDLRAHAIGRFMLPLLESHHQDAVEPFCYSDTPAPDAVTQQLRSHAHAWRDISGKSDADVDRIIAEDRIDILIDLAAHTPGNRLLLFARKPAPVQMTYLSYPSTTGIAGIDYRITDRYLDPRDDEPGKYTERSLYLPRTYWCYGPPAEAPTVTGLPVNGKKYITFGCLNAIRKASDDALLSWAGILQRVPDSRLLLLASEGSTRTRIMNVFAREGIAADRIQFVGYRGIVDYFQTYHQIDIAIDPFPYTGGTTTCDALWMGVPVITLAGKLAVHRGGVSILSNLGMPEMIAHSLEQYISIAAALAGDIQRLAEIRNGLRDRMKASRLMDAPQFASDLESLYRSVWKAWCDAPST